ncbi:dihydrolipoamide acetyltransferase family protein [Aurantiacibacter rhizosphaerae]|uniref:Dihydrolipoamide acetyltransferase component of pyruvate dehydrogenase complex n=1 Tax=Aurantiacibacter rhizosphaerae TaxID=2691582 RepID=A0A844XF91_9SPHN|nr:dihydrolipoamide acetyltransferase family protein [Aurantiacibacter rhizosphaerae]MWV28175.1 2-oxo acid dehydrogenase subunit E2 [Aurantiacibacter rhizosphaerae]
MAKFTFNLPDIGEGIAEAEIVAWHVQVGDRIEEDGQLADMMTDKATVEMESPVTGTVVEVAGEVGDVVAIGGMLAVIEVEGEVPDDVAEENEAAAEAAPETAPAPKSEEVETRIEVENPDASDQEDAAAAVEEKAAPAQSPTAAPQPASHDAKVLASPAVRKRAKDLGIDLSHVKPHEDGRVRHADLDSFIAYSGGYSGSGAARADEEIKVIGLRKRIAENMAAAKRNIPHFTYVEETDVTALEETRAQLNANRGDRPKLTMLPLMIAAICRTLPDFPMINARFDDEARVVTRHGSVHLGMATMTDNGLMVPVIRDAQGMNLWQLAREITRLAEAARDGTATSGELSGSTLTITSLGPLGGVATTPVINRPEVAIIGPNRIIERPMFVTGSDGQERIEKRKLMNISISCDHRVVDGYDAAAFVQELKKMLEAPATILAG